MAAEHAGLIKKESSWVKLKAFPTNVGRPNNSAADCLILLNFGMWTEAAKWSDPLYSNPMVDGAKLEMVKAQ